MEEVLENRQVRRQLRFKYLEGYLMVPFYILLNLVGIVMAGVFIASPSLSTPLMICALLCFSYNIIFRWSYYLYYTGIKREWKRQIGLLRLGYWIGAISLGISSFSLVEADHRVSAIAILAFLNPSLNLIHRMVIRTCISPATPLNSWEEKYLQFHEVQPPSRPNPPPVVHSSPEQPSSQVEIRGYQKMEPPRMPISRYVCQQTLYQHGRIRECEICLDEMEEKQYLATTLCGCTFHADCISAWIDRKNQCPTHQEKTPMQESTSGEWLPSPIGNPSLV